MHVYMKRKELLFSEINRNQYIGTLFLVRMNQGIFLLQNCEVIQASVPILIEPEVPVVPIEQGPLRDESTTSGHFPLNHDWGRTQTGPVQTVQLFCSSHSWSVVYRGGLIPWKSTTI